jgi:hypothetical protein
MRTGNHNHKLDAPDEFDNNHDGDMRITLDHDKS